MKAVSTGLFALTLLAGGANAQEENKPGKTSTQPESTVVKPICAGKWKLNGDKPECSASCKTTWTKADQTKDGCEDPQGRVCSGDACDPYAEKPKTDDEKEALCNPYEAVKTNCDTCAADPDNSICLPKTMETIRADMTTCYTAANDVDEVQKKCKDNAITLAKMKAALKGRELLEERKHHIENVYEEIKRFETVKGDRCGALSDDAEKLCNTCHPGTDAEIADDNKAECDKVKEPRKTMFDCITTANQITDQTKDTALAQCKADGIKYESVRSGQVVNNDEADHVYGDVLREVKGAAVKDALGTATADCKNEIISLQKKCFDDAINTQAGTLGKPVHELKEEAQEAAENAYAEKMATCLGAASDRDADRTSKLDTCKDEAKVIAANKLGKSQDNLSDDELLRLEENAAERHASKVRGECYDSADVTRSKSTISSDCDEKAKETFQDVLGMTKADIDVFDEDDFDRKKEEGAAGEMVDVLSACIEKAETAYKTCKEGSADNCDEVLTTDAAACDSVATAQFEKLTGESIDLTKLHELKEEAAQKQVGDLAKLCSDDVASAEAVCKTTAGDNATEGEKCEKAAKTGFETCRTQTEDAMIQKQFGKNKDDMSNREKAELGSMMKAAAGKKAAETGKRCRTLAGADADADAKAACKQEEEDAFFSARSVDTSKLDAKGKAEMETEFRRAKEEQAEGDTADTMQRCMEKITTTNASVASSARNACDVKAKKAYEDATGETVNPVDFRRKQEDAAAKDVNEDMMACNKDAFKLTDTAKKSKLASCRDLAMKTLQQTKGLTKDDVSGDSSKIQDFKMEYEKIVKEQAQAKVAQVIRAAAGKDMSKADRKAIALEAAKESMGKDDLTDQDLEMFMEEGAEDTVRDEMSQCVKGIAGTSGEDRKTKLGVCDDVAKGAWMEARMEDAVGLTGDEKVKKERDIEVEFKKAKTNAARKSAMDVIKAKTEIAKANSVDMTSAAFKDEKRDLVRDAFKETLGVDEIDAVEFEAMLIETSKQEAGDKLDTCWDVAKTAKDADTTFNMDAALAGCKTEAKAAAKEARSGKDTNDMKDNEFAEMMKGVARTKAADTMASFMESRKGKTAPTYDEKMNVVREEMKKSLATNEEISDSKVKAFVKKGAIEKAREITKSKQAGFSASDKRASIQAAMKDSLGKPDKTVGGKTVSQVTPSDAELFVEKASIVEVADVLKACKDANATSCDAKAQDSIKEMMPGGSSMTDKQVKMKLRQFRKQAAKDEVAALKEGCAEENVDAGECKTSLKTRMQTLLGKDTVKDEEISMYVLEGSDETGASYMESCMDNTATSAADCVNGDVKKAVLRSRGEKEDATVEDANIKEAVKRGVATAVKSRVSACIRAAEADESMIQACTSEEEFEKDLKKFKVGASATVTLEEKIQMHKDSTKAAVQEAADNTKSLPEGDRLTEFRKTVKEHSGLDLEKMKTDGNHMLEIDILEKAADTRIAKVARACANAGKTAADCDVDSEDLTKILKPTGGGGRRRFLTAGRRLAETETQKKRVRQKGARSIIGERMSVCIAMGGGKDATTKCVKDSQDVKTSYKQLRDEKFKDADTSAERSAVVVEKLVTCLDAEKTLKTCKDESTAILSKIADDVGEDIDGALGRYAFKKLIAAETDCATNEKVACKDQVKTELKEKFGMKDKDMKVKAVRAAEKMASDELALCDATTAAKADCEKEVKDKYVKFSTEEDFEAKKAKFEKVKSKKKEGKASKIVTRIDEVDTVLEFDGDCDNTVIEKARNDIGAAASDGKDAKKGAPTKLISKGKMGTKCMAVYKTKVEAGKAEEKSTKIAEKATSKEGLGKVATGKKRRLARRSLDGATSTSSSATQEEVVEGEENSTEDYSTSGTAISDLEKKDDSKTTTPSTPSAAEEDKSSLSRSSTATIVTATMAVAAVIMGLML